MIAAFTNWRGRRNDRRWLAAGQTPSGSQCLWRRTSSRKSNASKAAIRNVQRAGRHIDLTIVRKRCGDNRDAKPSPDTLYGAINTGGSSLVLTKGSAN